MSDAALNKLRQKHHKQLLGKADKAVDLQRQCLIADEDIAQISKEVRNKLD